MIDPFEIQQAMQRSIENFKQHDVICARVWECEEELKTTKHKEYYTEKLNALKRIKDSYGY